MKKIMITGDVAIDHLYLTIPQQDEGENWQLYPALHETLLPGGAFVLAQFVKDAIRTAGIRAEVTGQEIPVDLHGEKSRELIQAKILLEKHTQNNTGALRVSIFNGYSSQLTEKKKIPVLEKSFFDVDILVLDDAGNGFRSFEKAFPACIENNETLLVYKMSRPLACGKLWDRVSVRKQDWVLVLQATDIRMCNNVHVSKALSWERSAMEMVFHIRRNPSLFELQKVPWLVVLFGTDGALLIPQNQEERPILIFDPLHLEGGFASTIKGYGLSRGSVFTAALTAALAQHGPGNMVQGIKNGLSAMRNMLFSGFTLTGQEVSYPEGKSIFGISHHFSECFVRTSRDLYIADPFFWRILDEKTLLSKPLVTVDIVKNKSPEILCEIPNGKFNKLSTFDRSEIEQYNSIKNLILEYLDDPKTNKPLCIAVFGPPGSGKSYGIKQVLGSLGKSDLPTMTFNISQYASYDDLVADFHKIRDKVLSGTIPVAFFDEFDSDLDHHPLGWLKYFLSPMQDGEFKERETIHPIGKCIFVFAGGTRSSYRDFEQNISISGKGYLQADSAIRKEEEAKRLEQFRQAKGPDFVSRLRGFINILGPNPNHQEGRPDGSFIIRRAMILRKTFEVTAKTSQLFNSSGLLQVDEAVLRAMLNIPEYRHGARSMNAIIDMSRLTGKRKFDLSALPTPDQLNMHVDATLFMWMVAAERFYTLLPVEERFELSDTSPIEWEKQLIEIIARKIHEEYCCQRSLLGQNTPTNILWEKLPEDKKVSNLDAATDIPEKLHLINHGIRRITQNEPLLTPDISDEEIERLAKREHERWCRDHIMQGWKYGEIRDDSTKIHPNLLPWKDLSKDDQNKDREAIYAIPRLLREAGYAIYRLSSYEVINENLIMKIALAIHQDYCKQRLQQGQTPETNNNLVPFDQLTDDIREANLDSARTIPRKLKLLRIELYKASTENDPPLLKLTKKEIETLAIWEHTRWNWQKVMQGWHYGTEKDETKKTHPCILPWAQLTQKIKEYDRENVRLIPGFVKDAGYCAIRK